MSHGPHADASGVRLLADAAVDLIAARTAGEAARAVYRHLASHLDLDLFLLYVTEANGTSLCLESHEGLSADDAQRIARQPATEAALAAACALGLNACESIRLIGRDGFVGTLTFGGRSRSPFDPHEIELMHVVATHVAVAVERVRTLEQLRRSEQRVRATFDNAGVGLLEVDANDRLIEVNDRVCAILDYPREELLGVTIHDLTAPEDRAQSDRLNDELHRGVRDRIEYDKRYLKRDGTPVWVHVTVSPVRDAAGRWVRSIATIEDITERKAAEIGLRRVERQLRHHMDNSPLAIVQLDHQGKITRWSGSSEQVFGWRAQDVLGKALHEWPFVHPEDQTRFDSAIQQLLSGSELRNVTISRHCTAHGTVVHCEWYNSAWTDEDGARSIVARVLDVTARHRAEDERSRLEAERASSEQRFRELAEAMPQIVWTADGHGHVDYYNRRWEEFTGLSVNDGHGSGWAPVVHPDDAEMTLEAWTNAIRTGSTYQVEHRVRCADGGFRWLLSRGVPVRNESGQVRWYGTATDIHAQKQAAEALREADRRKDEFLATLAHELRNPLAPIRFALKLLEQAQSDEATVQRSREVIERQVAHLVRLVDDLLDVSRITRNKIQLRKERVRLRTLMTAALESTEPLLRAAGHRLETQISGDPAVHADAARLVQVFTNLLNNAVKFTPPGGDIFFGAEIRGENVVVRVRDTGVGITAEALHHVFDMFHQADNSLDRTAGGLGIGLTLSRRLVEMHDGSIEASSDGIDRGAEFSVCLPVVQEETREERRTRQHGQTPEIGQGMRVLIVDDNIDSAEMLSLIAEMQGHETRMAHDGPAALRAYADFAPHVVLLDIGLPGMNGYDVARELRATYGHAGCIVAITGWGQEDDRRRARDAGFDCHMTKPADPDVLGRLLHSISAGEHCEACHKCLHTPLTRSGDLSAVTDSARASS